MTAVVMYLVMGTSLAAGGAVVRLIIRSDIHAVVGSEPLRGPRLRAILLKYAVGIAATILVFGLLMNLVHG